MVNGVGSRGAWRLEEDTGGCWLRRRGGDFRCEKKCVFFFQCGAGLGLGQDNRRWRFDPAAARNGVVIDCHPMPRFVMLRSTCSRGLIIFVPR